MSKSNSERSVSGTSPIVAGGGMESIVSGLCRKEAKAGMVSNIDESNATCDVVLFERKDYLKTRETESIGNKRAPSISVPRKTKLTATVVDSKGL